MSTPQETHALRDACAAELPGGMASVHCPEVGQTVDASTGSSAFQAGALLMFSLLR